MQSVGRLSSRLDRRIYKVCSLTTYSILSTLLSSPKPLLPFTDISILSPHHPPPDTSDNDSRNNCRISTLRHRRRYQWVLVRLRSDGHSFRWGSGWLLRGLRMNRRTFFLERATYMDQTVPIHEQKWDAQSYNWQDDSDSLFKGVGGDGLYGQNGALAFGFVVHVVEIVWGNGCVMWLIRWVRLVMSIVNI